jgi:riboflavin-specific deaminase-like protein
MSGQPAPLRRLLPPGGTASAADVAEDLAALGRERAQAAERPYLALNMVSTADGRVTVGGRSGALSSRADRELFHALRGVVDAVLVGAGTARAERYGRMVRDARGRARRRRRGLAIEPLACIVSASLQLPPDLPLLRESAARVVVLTSSPGRVAGAAAQVEYLRTAAHGRVDLAAGLRELHDGYGVRTLLCEGGPHLNAQLLGAGLVDELFLSLAPKLAGGDRGEPRIVIGAELAPPVALELIGALESQALLLLRYRVVS